MTGYRGARVVVIGGLGFLGTAVTARLLDLGASVTVVARARARHAGAIAGLERRGVRIVEADVRDGAAMTRAVGSAAVVFNLAGRSGAARSVEDPSADLDVNVRGMLVLLEALRHANPGAALVFPGSRLQYGRPAAVPVPETAPLHARCPHALHKTAAEGYARVYGRLFGLRAAAARITNPYGPGQPRGRSSYGVINHLIHRAVAGEPLRIYGDGRQLRDYVHVDDVAAALLRLGEAATPECRAYNVGSGLGTPLVEAARLVLEAAGGGRIEHVEWPPLDARIETGDFIADISRIRAELGWTPAVGLRDGIERTVAHYRAVPAL